VDTTECPSLLPASEKTVAITIPLASPPIITGDEFIAITSSATLPPLPAKEAPEANVEAEISPMPDDSHALLTIANSEASPAIFPDDEPLPAIPPLPIELDDAVTISDILTTPTELEGLEELTKTSPPPLPSTITDEEPAAMEGPETLPPPLAHEESETFSDEVTTSSELYANEPLATTSTAPSPPIFSGDEPPACTIAASPFEQVSDAEPETISGDIPIPKQAEHVESTATNSFPPLLPGWNDIEPLTIANSETPTSLAQDEPETS
jgi:hypothetical protein